MRHWQRALYVNVTARVPMLPRAPGGSILGVQRAVLERIRRTHGDDRGEINSSVAWAGAMVLLAVTIAGIVTAKATGFADAIDFGGP